MIHAVGLDGTKRVVRPMIYQDSFSFSSSSSRAISVDQKNYFLFSLFLKYLSARRRPTPVPSFFIFLTKNSSSLLQNTSPVKMKYTVVFFALAAVAMGELTKVPRSRLTARQDGAPKVQGAAMSLADGSVVTFDSTKVYKAASEDGI